MAVPKGTRIGGRQRGTPNKRTAQAAAAIEDAFDHLQSLEGKDFNTWASHNVDDFYKLLFPKLLPVQLNHAGSDGEKLVINIVRQGD